MIENGYKKNQELYLLTCSDKIVEASKEFINLTGFDRSNFIGKSFQEICNFLKVNIIIKNDYINFDETYYIFTKQGKAKKVNISCQDLNFQKQKIYYFIDGQIKGEQTKMIEQQEKKLEAIIQNISDGLYTIDKNKNINLLNQGAKDFFCEPDKIKKLGDSFKSTIYYDSMENLIPIEKLPFNRIFSGEKLLDYRLKVSRPDGIFQYSISGSPVYDSLGNISMAIICTRDVTEVVNSEQEIKKQRKDLYKTLDSLNFPIACFSYPDFNILEINKNAYDFISLFSDIAGAELRDLNGKNITEYIKNFYCGNNYISINKMIKIKSPVYFRECIVKTRKKELYVNLLYQPVYDIKGEIDGFFIILVDITDEVIEKKNIQKSMDNQKEFFSFITHEFKTPLTTMNSTIQLLEHIYNHEMTENIKKYIKTLKKSTFQQLRLVNNLLDITRAEAGYLKTCKKNTEIVSLTRAITESINSYAKLKKIEICFCSDIKEKIVALDEEKYERILLNLLSNAIKFTPIGKLIYVSITPAINRINICVKDEGVGIPLDKQQIIFDRFGQASSKLTKQSEGTGLGLYLVKLLVKAINGEIDLISEENKGSTFIISLPDIKVKESEEKCLPELSDNRLVQSLQIEFSNIYFE